MLPTGEIEGVDPGQEGEFDQKCTFLAGFGHFFPKKASRWGNFDVFQGSWRWPGQEVTKTETKHSSKLRLKGFASKSHPLQNTIFIGISGDSENKSYKGPT